MMKSLLIAGMGGFVGTAFRFAVSRYIQIHTPTVFPWGDVDCEQFRAAF